MRRLRLAPVPGVRFRPNGDGSVFVEYDDAALQAAYGVLAAATNELASTPEVPGPSQNSQRQAAIVGDSPLTIKPPSVAMGQAGMYAGPSGQGAMTQPPISPPPPPHGMGGLPGVQSNTAPVPGVPVLPQPAVASPPPAPNMTPAGTPANLAPVRSTVPSRKPNALGQAPTAGSYAPQVIGPVHVKEFDGDVNGIEIELLKDKDGNVLRDGKGVPMSTAKVTGEISVLPQPPISAPPPPPVVSVLGPDGMPARSEDSP